MQVRGWERAIHCTYCESAELMLCSYCVCCRDFLALNVYVALCYYKLDYYDVSQEVLAVYLQSVPDSTIALNLKACNHFRLYNGKAAEVTQLDKRVLSKSFSKLNLVCLNVALLMFLRLQSVTPKCTTL
jgi:hypothetical protein